MKFYKLLLILPFIVLVVSCSGSKKEEEQLQIKYQYHYNTLIVPDLSNRVNPQMYPKQVDDESIVSEMLKLIDPKILRFGRDEGQQDVFSVSFINERVINLYDLEMGNLKIDFSSFDNQLNRINYIKGLSQSNLKEDISKFEDELARAYNSAKRETYGADIWSYFKSLDKYQVKGTIDTIKYRGGNTQYIQDYKNVMILMTDGYLESGIYDQTGCKVDNLCYFMSGRTIKKFREEFKSSGMSNIETFFDKKGYGIVPVDNPILENLEVLLLEAFDRSLDKSGNATVYPSDFEIMKLFWEDWMEKSGVKRFEIYQTAADVNEARQRISDFIGIN